MSSIQRKTERAVQLNETGTAEKGADTDEVVIGLSPGFALVKQGTLSDVPHTDLLRELLAGIEEEGLQARVVRIHDSADLGVIGLTAARLSGSGIAIGVQSRGTTLIHQEDLVPLDNLELFPQAPLLTPETFRAIGRNAARYARSESPEPVTVENDPMTRPKYQALAAVWHIKEMEYLDENRDPTELDVQFD